MKEIKHTDEKFMVLNREPYHIQETRAGMVTAMPDWLTYEIFDTKDEAKQHILGLDPDWVDPEEEKERRRIEREKRLEEQRESQD